MVNKPGTLWQAFCKGIIWIGGWSSLDLIDEKGRSWDLFKGMKEIQRIPKASGCKRWKPFPSCLVLTCLLLLMIGCMKMGPDFQKPDTGIPVPDSYQQAPKETGPSH